MTDTQYDDVEVNTYLCESCGLEEQLTTEQAFQNGWDYPPFIGVFGIVSPRTCPTCPITTTVWWAVMVEHVSAADLSDEQLETVKRIQAEVSDAES